MEGLKSRPAAKEEVKEEEEAEATEEEEEKVVADRDVCCMAVDHYPFFLPKLTNLHEFCDNSRSTSIF